MPRQCRCAVPGVGAGWAGGAAVRREGGAFLGVEGSEPRFGLFVTSGLVCSINFRVTVHFRPPHIHFKAPPCPPGPIVHCSPQTLPPQLLQGCPSIDGPFLPSETPSSCAEPPSILCRTPHPL